jgi:hypothetical protein
MSQAESKAIIFVASVPVFAILGFLGFPQHPIAATVIAGIVGVVLVGLTLAWLSVVEEEKRLVEKRRDAEGTLKSSPTDVSAIVLLNMAKLDEYYALNKSQARNSFLASIVAVSIGFVVLVFSIRYSQGSRIVPGAISGVLLQFIGQLNFFYGKLVRLQDTMLAVQQCELLNPRTRDRVREILIVALINRPEMSKASLSDRGTPRIKFGGRGKSATADRTSKHQPAS